MLRREPSLERVLLVLSNGRHPDPTKPDAEVDGPTRLRLCQAACGALADPAASYLARQAAQAGETLRLTPERLAVSTVEFALERAVRTAELLPLLRGQAADDPPRLHWLAGSDLVRRMADPRIFSQADVEALAAGCRYHVLERPEEPLAPALAALHEARGVALDCAVYPLEALPAWLAPFLALSSTAIRHAAEAGDPLAGMLPGPAAALVRSEGLYAEGRLGARLLGPDGSEIGRRSRLALALEALQQALEAEAAALAEALEAARAAGRPHALAVVETSAGGLVAAALAARSGASHYLRQARLAYDAHAKARLLAGGSADASAVSEESVRALAEAMRREAGADFALAESGMAGPPDGQRRSLKNGQCWLACAGPGGTRSQALHLAPFLTRREHQLAFARGALALARDVVRAG